MKKNDIILIISILLITLCLMAGVRIYMRGSLDETACVLVTVDGSEYGKYPLNENLNMQIEYDDGNYNILVIEDGYASIEEASCPDQICVNHFHIHYKGETIVCLPNKLVVEIVGGEESEIDGSTF